MFQHDGWIQVYIYSFMYFDTETMEEEDYFPATNNLLKTTREGQIQN